jgi:hypothetical protein
VTLTLSGSLNSTSESTSKRLTTTKTTRVAKRYMYLQTKNSNFGIIF